MGSPKGGVFRLIAGECSQKGPQQSKSMRKCISTPQHEAVYSEGRVTEKNCLTETGQLATIHVYTKYPKAVEWNLHLSMESVPRPRAQLLVSATLPAPRTIAPSGPIIERWGGTASLIQVEYKSERLTVDLPITNHLARLLSSKWKSKPSYYRQVDYLFDLLQLLSFNGVLLWFCL